MNPIVAVGGDEELARPGADVAGARRERDGRVVQAVADALRRGSAPATPRGSSGGGAAASSRAHRGGSRCRARRRTPAPRRAAGRRRTARGSSRSSPNAAPAMRRADAERVGELVRRTHDRSSPCRRPRRPASRCTGYPMRPAARAARRPSGRRRRTRQAPAHRLRSRARAPTPCPRPTRRTSRGGPTNVSPAASQSAANAVVLGEEPVAGMDQSGSGLHRGVDDRVPAQVRLGRRRRAYPESFVGAAHVRRFGVSVGVHRHGPHAHPLRRPEDAQRDLTAVGDENGLGLRHRPMVKFARGGGLSETRRVRP